MAFVVALPLATSLQTRHTAVSPLRRPTLRRSSRRVFACTPAPPEGDTPPTAAPDTEATAPPTTTTATTTTPTATEASTSSEAASSSSAGAEAKKPPFEIRGFSLANVGLLAGGLITISSFSSFLGSSGTASATSLGFVYGVPILLIGCALKYAELQPVPVASDGDAAAARARHATATQLQVYKDVTRHRYGDEGHLQPALSSLGLIPRGEPCPVLQRGTERAVDGGNGYEIELEFYSVATPYKVWVERMDRYDAFFGPGVTCSVRKISSEQRLVGLTITTTTGASEGEKAPASS